MKRTRSPRASWLLRTLALACGLAAWLAADAVRAEPGRAASTRSGSSGRSVSSAGSSGRAVPRVSGPHVGRSTRSPRTPSYRFPRRGHGHGHGYGLHIGYYGYYGLPYFYPSIYGPYYPAPYGYGYPYGRVYAPLTGDAIGALDLDVKPKKVEVWVDGQLAGTAGKFDGYPGFLWLTEGAHEIVFYRDGYETVVRQIDVLPGNVAQLGLQLVPGESRLPQQVMSPPAPAARERDTDVAWRAPLDQGREARRDPAADAAPDLDLRLEPGSFAVEVAPPDASIYLDGRFLGTAEELGRLHAGLIVEPGDHRLEVVRPGYASRELAFVVEAGQRLDLVVELERL